MLEKELNLGGRTFFYREGGSGDAVVLLHGFAEEGSVWKHFFHALDGYRLLIPDLPGSGKSEMIDDMSMEGLANAIHSWLQQIGVTSCVLIGHSMGGYITLAFAEKYGAFLRGFGLFHSTAFADSEEKKKTRQKGIQFIQKQGTPLFLENMVPGLYAAKSKEAHPEWIKEHLALVCNFLPQALVSYYQAMMERKDRTEIWKNAPGPVLLIAGKEDAAIPQEEALKLAHMPRLSYIHVLKNSAHMGMIEEPEAAVPMIREFIQSIEIHAATP